MELNTDLQLGIRRRVLSDRFLSKQPILVWDWDKNDIKEISWEEVNDSLYPNI